jgi:hypothetical protein
MFRIFIATASLTIIFVSSCVPNRMNCSKSYGLWLSAENHKIWFHFEKANPYLYPIGHFEKFAVTDTSYVFINPANKKIKSATKEINFSVVSENKDSLVLIGPKILKRWFGLINGQLRDTLVFSRTYPKNSGNFESIEFETTGCYGTCPQMKLKINKTGAVSFEGIDYTEKNGYYSGKLTGTQLNFVKRNLSYLNFRTLDEHYEAMWTDDETCKISIRLKDKIIKTSVYGFDNEPVPLRIFINELKELYKDIDMKKDSMHAYYDLMKIPPR